MPSIQSCFRPQREGSNTYRSSRSRSPRREEDERARDRAPKSKKERNTGMRIQTDVILPMQEPYMQQIVTGEKTCEFRKYCLKRSIERIWFYRTALTPASNTSAKFSQHRHAIPAIRHPKSMASETKSLTQRHKDWDGYDFAYKILSVYKLDKPITLKDLRTDHGMRSAPRGLIYTPLSLIELVDWKEQSKLR